MDQKDGLELQGSKMLPDPLRKIKFRYSLDISGAYSQRIQSEAVVERSYTLLRAKKI